MPLTIQAMATATAPARRRLAQTTPPEAFFVVSAVFHYLGPAFAVLLFARLDILGVAWLRIASAAAIFALWRRPWRTLRAAGRPVWLLLAGWGATLATMNRFGWSFHASAILWSMATASSADSTRSRFEWL